MNAGQEMRANKRAYGDMLKTLRQAESLERVMRRGDSRENIAKAVAGFKQAAARSGPIILHTTVIAAGQFNITQGKRVTQE